MREKGCDSMANYDTVVFDMDGTTLNTLEDLADSVNFTLHQCGYPARSLADIRRFVGNGVARLMALSIPGGPDNPQYERCLRNFKAHYERNMENKTAPYPGIPGLLKELCAKNYRLAIVSNKPDEAVKQLARKYFGQYIRVAVGETAQVCRKPAPDSVHQALAVLGSSPARAVYVGDSEVDVQTARNAGMVCVGVTWGFRDRAVLKAEGADFIIDRPDELMDILGSAPF